MTGLRRADRREYLRYKVQVEAELVTHAGEIASCTVLDISPTGASVSCTLISEHLGLKLRLKGFGEIKVSRLRANYGVERLLFRDTDNRSQQFMRFLINLVDAGAALPAFDRRQLLSQQSENGLDTNLAGLNDALLLQVDRALRFVAQMTSHDIGLPNNIVAFRTKKSSRRPDAPPNQIA